tara:strand:+ start:2686 stop:3312 length:627 start_codon:yes stop_codon:yes gene_type:complete
MSHREIQKNFHWLNVNRIVTRQDPHEEPTIETHQYWYFEDGTHQAYDLFKSKAKINTFRSLKWHLLVLWYLNPEFSMDDFQRLANFIVDKENGFCTFGISDTVLDRIVYDVSMADFEDPPKNKLRKVIFKMSTGLEKIEKLRIVGTLIGRSKRVHPDDIYQCMLDLHDMNQKITIERVSRALGCSSRTIHRNMDHPLKKEKELLNNEL